MLTRLGGMAATAPHLQIELLLERVLCHSQTNTNKYLQVLVKE